MISREYRHTVEVYRSVESIDENKVLRKSLSKVSECKGNLQTLSGDAIIIGDREQILSNYRLFTDVDSDIRQGDILRILGRDYKIYTIDNLLLTHQEVLLSDKVK